MAALQELLRVQEAETPGLFMDATHPTCNARPAYGWMRRGVRTEVASTPGRKHVNLNGAVNAETHEVFVVEGKRIDAASTIERFRRLEARYPPADTRYVFTGNARYEHAKAVSGYVKTSRIGWAFLPTYPPNLNLVERLGKRRHRHTAYHRSYPSYQAFRQELLFFFARLPEEFSDSLRSLLILDFPIASEAAGRKQAAA